MLAAETFSQARELVSMSELPANLTPPADNDCLLFERTSYGST